MYKHIIMHKNYFIRFKHTIIFNKIKFDLISNNNNKNIIIANIVLSANLL